MATDTKIEWVCGPDGTPGKTWNPIRGCSHAPSLGCQNCYAERIAGRFCGLGPELKGLPPEHTPDYETRPFYGFAKKVDGRARWTGRVELLRDKLDEPKSWRKPVPVFVNSMSDLFHESLPFEQIHEVWCAMTGPAARHHTYMVLTKRYERMVAFFDYLRDHICREYGVDATGRDVPDILRLPQPHIRLGHSYANQRDAERGMGHLINTPAALRFVSLEPLLGPIQLRAACPDWHTFIGWVIVGGESGPGARPCDVQWIRDIVHQCRAAKVPCFVKQLGTVPMESEEAWRGCAVTRLLSARNSQRVPAGMVPLAFQSHKAADPSEWPLELRCREVPA